MGLVRIKKVKLKVDGESLLSDSKRIIPSWYDLDA
jgi:hypothetical protein